MIEKINIQIWGREFNLPIVYEKSKGQITEEQTSILQQFLSQKEALIAKAKDIVVDYCKNDVNKDASNTKKDNIFSYIRPNGLYVKRHPFPRVALMCNYKYNEDDGIAIVFNPDGKIKVGEQGIA